MKIAQEQVVPDTQAGKSHLRRMMRLVWPHRGYLFVGIVSATIMGVCYSGSIGGILPALKIIFEDEGLHGWVDRTLVEQQFDAELDTYDAQRDQLLAYDADGLVVVRKLRPESPLNDMGVRNGDMIVALNGERSKAGDWFMQFAMTPAGTPLTFTTVSFAADTAETSEHSFTTSTVDVRYRAAAWAAALIPREKQRTDRTRTLLYVLFTVMAISIVGNVFRFLSQYYVTIAITRGVMDLRRHMYSKTLRLPMTYFSRNISDTLSRFIQDTGEIQRGLTTVFGKMSREPMKALFVLILALAFDWRLTLAVLVIAPAAILVIWSVGRSVRKASNRLLTGYGKMIGALEATLGGIGVVKSYTMENAERVRLWNIDRKMIRATLRMALLEAMVSPLMEVAGLLAVSAGIVWLGNRAIQGTITTGEFTLTVIILAALFDPVRKLSNVYNRIQRANAAAERVFGVLDAPPEEELLEGAVELTTFSESIEYRNVTFTYPESTLAALDSASLRITKGETIAIVGPNGSGKTTLVNMLPRFFDPQEGLILFDGIDLKKCKLRNLRRQLSLVPQDPVIFATSMKENIAYGRPNATDDEVREAAQKAFADEFIQTMPNGYDTISGERGATLSGGQKQRISIARAILNDAPILIFDEATSQIDAESEQKIQKALASFSKDRTTLIIAHRLSTIQFADRIAVMDAGKVIDTGTHEELMDRCTIYRGLCESQFIN